MYSAVVQRTLIYLEQLILKQDFGLLVLLLLLLGFLCGFWFDGGLVFWPFFCSWQDRAAKTLCFLTLPPPRSVITGDSTLALSLPAWILRGWERPLAFRAWLSGEECFTALHLALTLSWQLSVYQQLQSLPLINPKIRV